MLRAPILAVIGTRPEAIKQAPVVQALARRGLSPTILLTGQHPTLDLADHGLDGFEVVRLGCKPQSDPMAFADQVATATRPICEAGAELIIVQGDTSSALGGALAGFDTSIPVAHVEAGLRSFDPAMPWPEESNRIAIDARAHLLFAPTETSASNLRAESVPGQINVTGNTAIDALRQQTGLPPAVLRPAPPEPLLLVTCHRRENWGEAFASVAKALLTLAKVPGLRIDVLLHPNPAMTSLTRHWLAKVPAINLLPPLDHSAMICAMQHATVMLSDSGGVQEEAPALGVPLLVLRDKTERPEALTTGNMKLVGTATDTLIAEVRRILDEPLEWARMAVPALPYGDGHAGERIAALVEGWLAERGAIVRSQTA